MNAITRLPSAQEGGPGIYTLLGRRGPGPDGPGGQVEDLNGADGVRRGVVLQRDREQLAIGRQRDALRGLVAHRSGCQLGQVAGLTGSGDSEPEQAEIQAGFGWFLASLDSDNEAAVIGSGGDEGAARVGLLHRDGRRHRDGTGDLPAGGRANHRLYPAAVGGGTGRDVEARQAGRG